jgi:hypothetical protein
VNRFVLWAVLALMLHAVPAVAQTTDPPIQFMSRYQFRLGAEHLSGDDERFVWDTNFGGEVDLLDYGRGRATFVANYQAILGEEFRNFDPNQGNYILGGSVSMRFASVEVAGVFHHTSRHLSDRPKRPPVDWNMFGGRVRARTTRGALESDARLDIRGVVQKSFVDYRWELDGGVRNLYRVAPAFALVSEINLRLVGVDGTQDRGGQTGFRAEGGVRVDGRAGAIEVFVAAERRVDPYPLEFGTETWLMAGFRLVSR